MKAKEFLTEQQMDEVHDLLDVVQFSLPNTYKLDKLTNNDFYPMYRFGVAIADVRGHEADNNPLNKNINVYKPKFNSKSRWGENMIVSGFDSDLESVIKKSLQIVGKSGITPLSTASSDEMSDVNNNSILPKFRGYVNES